MRTSKNRSALLRKRNLRHKNDGNILYTTVSFTLQYISQWFSESYYKFFVKNLKS